MIHNKVQALCLKLILPALAIAIAVPARAVSVTFSTTGVFTCAACTGSGTNTVTYSTGGDTLTLSFAGLLNKTVVLKGSPPQSNSSAGSVTATTTSVNGVDVTPTTFKLGITQTSPIVGAGPLSGTVDGTIAFDSSDGAIQFSSTTLNLGGVTYTLQEQTQTDNNKLPGYDLEPPDTNGGVTSLQMHIVETALPEPTFMALTGVGFVGISLFSYRRRQRA